jgi:hypothetical protein
MLPAVYRLKLIVHDSPGPGGSILSQITCKTGDSWDYDNNSKLAAFLSSTDASVDNCTPNSVMDGGLFISGGSD